MIISNLMSVTYSVSLPATLKNQRQGKNRVGQRRLVRQILSAKRPHETRHSPIATNRRYTQRCHFSLTFSTTRFLH